MPYQIYQSDGTPVTVPDNTIDQSFYNPTGGGGSGPTLHPGLGIQLIGRNAVDYGSALAQNFLQLTENFCSSASNPPSDTTSLQGQLWFAQSGTGNGNLYVRVNATGLVGVWEQLLTTGGGTAALVTRRTETTGS